MASNSLERIVEQYGGEKRAVIAMLQDLQRQYNYLPRDVLVELSARLGVPLTRIYGIATFFKAFSLVPKGKYPISVCLGTACHVRGGDRILDRIQRELNIGVGETTPDGLFSLETVRCLGCCGLSPVITVGEDLHGQLTPVQAVHVLQQYRQKAEQL
jgi:NADH:ubiquinone oxidoreductase subunit E